MNLYQLFLTANDCYRVGRTIVPGGVMLHSTGSNNPNLRRYVGPNDGRLGQNSNGNHWNRPGVGACVHAFIGLLDDGTVAAYQTLPWNYRGWHCGGKANDTHISIELCEDTLSDPAYFEAVYQEAVELTAHLCRLFDLDPLADGVVICHQEGCRRGIASNHADVFHWFPNFGKTMDDFRADVARLWKGEERMTQAEFDAMLNDWLARRGEQAASSWAEPVLEQARKEGVTDGSRPRSFATREEVAAMVTAAMK